MASTGADTGAGDEPVDVAGDGPHFEADHGHTNGPGDGPASPAGSSWAWRIGMIALIGVLLAIAVGLIGATLARYDIIGKLPGFLTFMGSIPAALVAGAIGLIALIVARIGKSGPRWPAVMAIVLSLVLGLVGYFMVVAPGRAAPPLHDITTNVDAPPQFATIELREDNLVPFQSMAEWRNAHRTGYPNIAPIIIERSPEGVLGSARVLAEERGWKIANVDPAAGKLEATAFAGYIRFRDDVIVQVTPIADGSTRVDMRSVSRVGVSDLGYNAKRIEEFLGALAAAN